MNIPLGVSPSKGNQGTTRGKEKIFSNRIKSFFPYKDKINRSQMSKVVYKASCWDCQDFYIGKTKRRLHDRQTEHFKGSRVPVMHLLSQTTSRQLVTT